MKTIQGHTFRDDSVQLDGKHFVDCTFIDCTLEYGGGDLVLERTSIYSCKHQLFGYARQTAEYMRTVGLCDSVSKKWTEYTGPIN